MRLRVRLQAAPATPARDRISACEVRAPCVIVADLRVKDNAVLSVENISKIYQDNTPVIQDLDLQVKRGEFVSLVGPSGCGKSTLLKCISGLMAPTRGRVLLDGRPVTSPPREMAFIFQNYTNSLLPWRRVLGNVLMALETKPMSGDERRHIARESLDSVGLDDYRDFYPWQLSGGMQQRVAIARGLAYGSDIILMDEPFASVDAQTRAELEDLVQGVYERFGKTFIFVTHDIDEAVYLSSRIVLLTRGPARVSRIFDVDIPRPRTQLQTRADPAFLELRNQIYSLLET